MNWLIFVVISVLGSAISTLIRRVIMKRDKNDALATVIIFQFMGFVIVSLFAFFHGFVMPPLATYPLHFAAQAVLWGLSSLFLFKASETLEASEITILSTVSSLITIATAVFFLNEIFSVTRIIGAALILSSVVFVSFQADTFRLNKGVLFALGEQRLCGHRDNQ